VISQITFSGVLSEPRITFVIRKSYHADSKDDAIMARLPGCEKPSAVHIIKHNFYYLIDSGDNAAYLL